MNAENFTHDIAVDEVVLLSFDEGPWPNQLHAVGCAHAAKADRVWEPENAAQLVHDTLTTYVDDYYYVAPCARRRAPAKTGEE